MIPFATCQLKKSWTCSGSRCATSRQVKLSTSANHNSRLGSATAIHATGMQVYQDQESVDATNSWASDRRTACSAPLVNFQHQLDVRQ